MAARRIRLRTLGAALAVSCLLVARAAKAAEENADALKAGVFSPARAAPDFRLRGSDGTELTLARYRGSVVVLVFGFTSCPKVCPTTLSTLARAHKRLTESGQSFQVVYVTVDPEHDDMARMHDYLASFDATFVGGTGSPDELAAVRQAYGIFANRQDEIGRAHV